MSFGKSKVERFPMAQVASTGTIRKRPYALSSSVVSDSSFHVTPPNKNALKGKSQKNLASGNSFSTGRIKKLPVERTSKVKKACTVISTKPGISTAFRGAAKKDGKSTPEKANQKQIEIRTPTCTRKASSQHRGTGLAGKCFKELYSYTTPKRQKIDETPNEKFFTPLTSPPRILFSEKSQDGDTVALDHDSVVEDQAEQSIFTLTLSPFLKSNNGRSETPRQATRIDDISVNEITTKKLNQNLCYSENGNDDTTITTSGRNSKRRSFPTPISANSTIINSQLNNSFIHFSLQDFSQNSQQFHTTNTFRDPENSSQSRQSFLHNNRECSASCTYIPTEAGSAPKKPLSFFQKIRHGFLNQVSPRIPRSFTDRSRTTGINALLGCEHNNHVNDALLRQRRSQPYWQHGTGVNFYGFALARATQIYRPSREMRRLIRIVRNETRQTIREIKVCVVVPAKLYVKSERFWLPIMEFVLGQAIEIIQTSIR